MMTKDKREDCMFNLITIQEIFVSLIVHQVKLLLCKVKFVTYNECAVFFISNISNHPSRYNLKTLENYSLCLSFFFPVLLLILQKCLMGQW